MSFFGNLTNLDLSAVQKNLTERASQLQSNLQAQATGLAGRIEAATSDVNALVRPQNIDWLTRSNDGSDYCFA
eukprot:6272427-Pyramimonas_sp.AAC.1